MRAAIAACRDAGRPPTRENVREEMALSGLEVTPTQLTNWTVNRAGWSPIRAAREEATGLHVLCDIEAEMAESVEGLDGREAL